MRNDRYVPSVHAILQSGNLYLFTMNNPIMFADPTGLFAVPISPFLISACIKKPSVKCPAGMGTDGLGGFGGRRAPVRTTTQHTNRWSRRGTGGGSSSNAQTSGTTAQHTNRATGQSGASITGENIVFGGNAKPPQRLANQMTQRGWTQDSVRHTIDNPHTTRNATNRATGNQATVFYNKDGSHVIIDNVTRQVVQVSDRFDIFWVPDQSIVYPFMP